MIEGLKPYTEYRMSDVPWAPVLPASWRTERAKRLFTRVNRPVRAEDGVVTCFRDGTVTLRKNRRLRGFTEATAEIGYQGIRKGDLVIHAMDAFAGAVGVSDSDGKGTPVYAVCQPEHGANSRYYAHTVREMSRSLWILALAKGIRERSTDFRFETFGNQAVPVPPPDEQTAIVRFLDHANQKIDRFIRAKRRLIALLNEQKQAIIHRAVTRGLNPDATLKPSGIPWLGDIPIHWDVRKLKTLVSTKGGMTPSKGNASFWGGDIPWVSPKDMKVTKISDSKDHITASAVRQTGIAIIQAPAVLIVVRGMILARTFPTALTTVPVTVNQDMKALMPKPVLNPGYFVSLLTGIKRDLLLLVEIAGHGTCCLRTDSWGNFAIPVPPIAEQVSIENHLNLRLATQNAAITRTESEITLMQEYRTRLTADIVTGKLDVREAAANLPGIRVDQEPVPDDSTDQEEAETDPI